MKGKVKNVFVEGAISPDFIAKYCLKMIRTNGK